MSVHRRVESARCPGRILSGENRQIEEGVSRVPVVLRLVVVGHPRRFFGRPGPSERLVCGADCRHGVPYVAHLPEGPGPCRVKHRLLGRRQAVGAYKPLLGVREAVIGGPDPYGLSCEERVGLGPQMPVADLLGAVRREPESLGGFIVVVGVEGGGAYHDAESRYGGEQVGSHVFGGLGLQQADHCIARAATSRTTPPAAQLVVHAADGGGHGQDLVDVAWVHMRREGQLGGGRRLR